MTALEDIMKEQILRDGPMGVDTFMGLALGHPEHGYYMKKDPFGRAGDFTTAPEVSQMFGEMLGAWAADTWMKMGSPAWFVLLECGPGRGTLMADMMRATKNVDGFHAACELHLFEMSPVLKAKQSEALAGYDPIWHDDLSTVPDDCPMIVLANEFFDALPMRQVVRQGGEWREREVDVEDNQLKMSFRRKPQSFDFDSEKILKQVQDDVVRDGDMFELSPAREEFMDVLCMRLKTQTGAGVIIDYGHTKSAMGDTLQAVYKHEYCDVLEHIGDADITGHVDFDALARISGDAVQGVTTQGDFLRNLGIEIRAQILAQKEPSVVKDLHRLVDPSEMGTLFKVMVIKYGFDEAIAGF